MVRAALARRFGGNPKIEVRAPEEIAALPPGSLDVVVLHSVAQYLTPKELDDLLVLFRRLLRRKRRLHPRRHHSAARLGPGRRGGALHFAARNGFLGAALVGLGRTFVSDYWRLRSNLGLTRYGEAVVMEKLTAAGFSARRAPANIGHNPARMTFLARPA